MAQASRFVRHHWPSLFLVLFVLGISLFGFAKPPPDAEPKPPGSWVVTPEAGQVFALVINANTVWAGGKDGVFRIDRKSGRLLEHLKLGTDVAMVRSLAVCPDGTLWIGHTNGLTWHSEGRSATFSDRDGLPGLRVNALFVGSNTLWIGTSNGLASIVDGKPLLSPLTAKLSSPVVNSLFEDASGDLWVGSSSRPAGGVTVLHNLRAKSFTVKEGLAHPYVQGIAQDPSGVVWVATGQYFDGGISAFEKASGGWKFKQVLHRKDGLAGEKARSIAVDADGNLWVGSESDGLAILHGSTSTVLSTTNGLPHNEITCIRFDSEGNAWLASLRGVVKIPFAEIERLIGPPPPLRGK